MRYFFIHKHNMTKQRNARFLPLFVISVNFYTFSSKLMRNSAWKFQIFGCVTLGLEPTPAPGPSRFLRHAKMARHAPIGTPARVSRFEFSLREQKRRQIYLKKSKKIFARNFLRGIFK